MSTYQQFGNYYLIRLGWETAGWVSKVRILASKIQLFEDMRVDKMFFAYFGVVKYFILLSIYKFWEPSFIDMGWNIA